MNKTTTGILALLLVFGLVSCTTGTGDLSSPEVEAPQAGAPETESVAPEPVTVWKPLSETVMSPDGTIDKKIDYEYDADGRLTGILERDGRDELLYQRSYRYENGVLVREDMSDRYGPLSTTDYVNDSRGLITRETKIDAQGEVLSIVTYEYDDDRVSKTVAADGQGIPHLSAEYAYDDEVVVEVVYLLPGGGEEARFIRTLEDGVAINEKTVLPDGSVETARDFEYEDGRLATEIHYAGTRETKRLRFEYDADGNVSRETWSNRKGLDYEIVEKQWILVEEI